MSGSNARCLEQNVLNALKIEGSNNGTPISMLAFYKKMLIQGKKMSQLICYIWYYGDKDRCTDKNEYETAQELDEYFKGVGDKDVSKLLFAQPSISGGQESDEYELLEKVFGKDLLPIFQEEDTKHVRLKVSAEKFEGCLEDPLPTDDKIVVMTIPYPPRPQIVDDTKKGKDDKTFEGYAPIRQTEIDKWIQDKEYDLKKISTRTDYDDKYFPQNYYMPASTC